MATTSGNTMRVVTATGTRPETLAVAGLPLRILRSEGLVLLCVALAAYVSGLDQPLWLVPLLFLPDASMVGYAHSSRTGGMVLQH